MEHSTLKIKFNLFAVKWMMIIPKYQLQYCTNSTVFHTKQIPRDICRQCSFCPQKIYNKVRLYIKPVNPN